MKMIGWKIYFGFLLILSIPSYTHYGLPRHWGVIDFIIYILATIGLFGFCWSKKIFTKNFWKILLPICIIWNIFYQYFIPLMPEVAKLSPKIPRVVLATIIWIPYIPLVIALYLYGFKNTELWGKNNTS